MTTKTAALYRMVMDDHFCPYGLKSKDLLQREGFEVEDHHLTTREEVDAFKAEHSVETTPQTFIDGTRIGGYDALRAHFDKPPEQPEGTTYQPVLAIFGTAALMALALAWHNLGTVVSPQTIVWFIAFSMVVLAVQKLTDVRGFSMQFLPYDLLSQRWVRYAYLYPFAELFAGLGMLAGVFTPLVAAVALFIGVEGSVSVIKAVYVDKRELKCACVGGESNVPLGAISLTENVMMALMGGWMAVGVLA